MGDATLLLYPGLQSSEASVSLDGFCLVLQVNSPLWAISLLYIAGILGHWPWPASDFRPHCGGSSAQPSSPLELTASDFQVHHMSLRFLFQGFLPL